MRCCWAEDVLERVLVVMAAFRVEVGLLTGVQQQHGAGFEVKDSSIVVRQQHVPSEPHASGPSEDWEEVVVISFISSLTSLPPSLSFVVRLRSSTEPCWVAVFGAAVLFGAVIVESNDLCSSVKDSSHVT